MTFAGAWADVSDPGGGMVCNPNPLTGSCSCPAGFVDEDLIDMDNSFDEGNGYGSVLHVCRGPDASAGADFRGAYGEVLGVPSGFCSYSCSDPNPYTGGCGCAIGTADDDFDGVHYIAGSSMDCQRSIGLCRSLPTTPFTYGGWYRVMRFTGSPICDAVAGPARSELNTITGGLSCPSGFVGFTYPAAMPHPDMVTYPNGFCIADMTICMRAP